MYTIRITMDGSPLYCLGSYATREAAEQAASQRNQWFRANGEMKSIATVVRI